MTQKFSDDSFMAVENALDAVDEEVFVFPLSFAQQRLWFLDQIVSGSPLYNLPAALDFKGLLDLAALEYSINEIIRRHESLRTTFTTLDGQPVQVIAPSLNLTLPVIDLTELPKTKQEAEVRYLANLEAQQPFNLEQGPLLRVTLLRLSQEEHVLFLTMHHIISDAWSFGVFVQELTVLYKAFSTGSLSPLPELTIQYADFAVWQRQWLQGKALESQLSYWKQQLNGSLSILHLPADRPRPEVQSFRGARHSLVLSKTLTSSLKALARNEGVTLFVALLAAFGTLLYRYTGSEDIVVGAPIAERNRVETEGLIGFFVNTLVLRTDLSGSPSFRELLLRVREVTLEARAHQDLPFEKLVETLQPERSLSQNPLFQVMFALQTAPIPTLDSGWNWSQLDIDTNTAKFDLTLELEERQEEIIGWLEYNTDIFDAPTISRMGGHFQTLLEGIVVNPDRKISKLPLLTPLEENQLLVEWNNTKTDYPKDACVHQLFEAQVERSPDAIAVTFDREQLTYRELNARANQLARYLQKLGVAREVLVGICVERSLEMVVGLLGILKAGGAYVPLDPAYPQERLTFILEDTQTPVLLTQARLVDSLPKHQARVICLDRDWETDECGATSPNIREGTENPTSNAIADNLAYVIYTSGSTGQPKGVQIEHKGLLNLIFWHQRAFGVTEADRATQIAGPAFDASVWELWPYLAMGASIHIPNEETRADLVYLRDWLVSQAITIAFLPTPLAERVLSLDWPKEVALRTLLTGGDKLHHSPSPSLPFQLVNNYGPTENSVVATSGRVSPTVLTHMTPNIGHPIANTQIYLLDAQMQPVPIGVAGELYISGAGLARGYLNLPNLTAERFIPNPFSNRVSDRRSDFGVSAVPEPAEGQSNADAHGNLYKTGDLARYLPDGNIEFLGRIDHQVKVRGFRIELGEIEAVLRQHPDVREAVVVDRENVPGNKSLVAYIVSNFISERVPYQSQCLAEFEGHPAIELTTEDMSGSGICLMKVPAHLRLGSRVCLRLSLPGVSHEEWIEGTIAWHRGQRAGIKFSLAPTQQALVQQSVDYIRETQGFLKVLQRTAIGNLRRFLKQKLPSYMMPDRFEMVNALPLTPNGKVDRRVLSASQIICSNSEETFVKPRTPIEEQMVTLWTKVLGVEKLGIHDNFFDLGGNSLLAAQLIACVRESFQIELHVRCIFEKPTIEELAQTVQVVKQEGFSALTTELDLKADAVLDPEIRPLKTFVDIARVRDPHHILLTGATGFVGAFLLDELLQQTQAQIYCLVRAANEREGLKKLQSTLEKYSLWKPSLSSRIIPILGNLDRPLLGLSQEQFDWLALQSDSIYHSGAQVNFVKPYSLLKAANVLGTQEVLRLACQGKVKPVHYMSTVAVFGDIDSCTEREVIYEEDNISASERYLDMGYTQSKWVAEQLVWIAKSRGLPVSIFRIGFAMGHSQTGIGNTNDLSSRLIKGCIQLGSYPELLDKKELFIPVDFASRAIVHLSRKKEYLGKAFHIVPTQPIPFVKLFELICSYGYLLKKLPYTKWCEKLIYETRHSQENALYPLVPLFSENLSQDQFAVSELDRKTPYFDCQNTLDGLADTDIICPPIDAKLLDTYLSCFIRRGFLQPPIE